MENFIFCAVGIEKIRVFIEKIAPDFHLFCINGKRIRLKKSVFSP